MWYSLSNVGGYDDDDRTTRHCSVLRDEARSTLYADDARPRVIERRLSAVNDLHTLADDTASDDEETNDSQGIMHLLQCTASGRSPLILISTRLQRVSHLNQGHLDFQRTSATALFDYISAGRSTHCPCHHWRPNLPGGCCICLEQSAGVSTRIAVTARFSQQTEDRAFCPVVQLF